MEDLETWRCRHAGALRREGRRNGRTADAVWKKYEHGCSRMTFILCTLFRVRAVDSTIYFCVVVDGNVLVRNESGTSDGNIAEAINAFGDKSAAPADM